MVGKDVEAQIVRLYHVERWRIGTIAGQLGIHHSTVRRVLARAEIGEPVRVHRPTMLDPFVAFVRDTLARYPRLRASRLYEMVRERGYPGRPDHFRHLIARIRPKTPAEAYLKLRTLPGEHYGESPVMVSPEKAPRGGAMFFRASFA